MTSEFIRKVQRSDGSPVAEPDNTTAVVSEGRVNLFKNPDFESGFSEWTVVTGEGSLSVTSVDPLAGGQSLLITNDYTGGTRYVINGAMDLSDIAYRSKLHLLEGTLDVSGANDSVRWDLYNVTNAAVVPGVGGLLQNGLNVIDGFTFVPGSDEYSLRITDVSGLQNDTVKADIFVATPQYQGYVQEKFRVYDLNDVTITPSSGTKADEHGYFVPYRDDFTGEWRMKFNYAVALSGAATATSFTFTVSGVTFKASDTQRDWALSWASIASDADNIPAYAVQNASTITILSNTSKDWSVNHFISGDVPLDGEPTWAISTPVRLLTRSGVLQNISIGLTASSASYTANTDISFNTPQASTTFGDWQITGDRVIIPATGRYIVNAVVVANAGIPLTNLQIFKDGVTMNPSLMGQSNSATTKRSINGMILVYLEAGDEVSLRIGQSVTLDLASSFMMIMRYPDYSGNLAVGSGTSDGANENDQYNLMRNRFIDGTLDNEFDSGEYTLEITGKSCTLTIDNAAWTGSQTSRATSALIPSALRPLNDCENFCGVDSGKVDLLSVSAAGVITLKIVSPTDLGTGVASTSPARSQQNITWKIDV